MASINPRFPDLIVNQTIFGIAFGIGTHLDRFAKSFANPDAYYYLEWSDWLLIRDGVYIMIQRFPY
jgi:hypothetical protein